MPAPSTPPTGAIAPLFALERDRLVVLLNTLREDDWQRPTPCPGWSVLGLTAHLLGDDLSLLSRRRDHHEGTRPPTGVSEDGFIDWLDTLQAEWVHAARRISPRLVIELLEWTGPRLVEVFSAENVTQPGNPVSWAGPRPAPTWLEQLRELSEYWIHRQQLLEALGRRIDLDPALLRPILLGLRWALPYRLAQTELRSDGAIEIAVGDPIDERWTLVATDGEWGFSEEPHENVIARASLTADETWRLLTNNLRLEPATLDVTGDPHAVATILGTRAIIGHPK